MPEDLGICGINDNVNDNYQSTIVIKCILNLMQARDRLRQVTLGKIEDSKPRLTYFRLTVGLLILNNQMVNMRRCIRYTDNMSK